MKMVLRTMLAMGMMMLMYSTSHAFYGTGMVGAMGACQYEVAAGDDAADIQDEIDEVQDELDDAKENLKDAKSRLRQAESERRKAERDVTLRGIKSEYFRAIQSHFENNRSCDEYKDSWDINGVAAVSQAPNRIPAGGPGGSDQYHEDGGAARGPDALERPEGGSSSGEVEKNEIAFPYTPQQWKAICDRTRPGRVLSSACGSPAEAKTGRMFDANACKGGLNKYYSSKSEVDEAKKVVEQMEASVKELQAAIKELRGEKKKAAREYAREQRREMTEGGCVDCMLGGNGYVFKQQKPSGMEIAANFVLGAGAILAGKSQNETIAKYNAKLGFPSSSYPSVGYGFPYIMAGLYGALGGGIGHGGFGCGSSMAGGGYANGPGGMMGPFGLGGLYGPNGGGAFGYPNGMYGPSMGGGIYMPGMGPWGMAGPWGNGGMMGYPGSIMMSGGLMMNGGMGMPMMGGGMMGYPMGSMMNGGIMMNGGMGMPMAGMPMSGGMMGYPMGGGGMISGGIMGGGMMGYPMGGMAGGGMMGYPMGGMMNGGIMMGGMAGGMMGFPMGGMSGGGMMGYPMGGMAGGMMGYPGGMMGMDMTQMQMQMYQSQMQMQMQQYQLQMQMQQRAYENYMNRQRVVMGLQGELQSLVYRIQQAQMGVYSGGYLGFDAGVGYGGTIGGGVYNSYPYGTTPSYGTPVPTNTGFPASTGGGVTLPPAGSPSVR